jgi:hypothetical protein
MITAAVLAHAVAGLPVLLNRCAASCETQHEAAASTPSCHHASSTGTRMGHVPLPCGHDHDGVLIPAVRSAPLSGGFDSIVPIQIASASFISSAGDERLRDHAPPGSSSALNAQALPLRI